MQTNAPNPNPPTANTLQEAADVIGSLRRAFLADIDDPTNPEATQHYLLAIDALNAAQHHMTLAHYSQNKRNAIFGEPNEKNK